MGSSRFLGNTPKLCAYIIIIKRFIVPCLAVMGTVYSKEQVLGEVKGFVAKSNVWKGDEIL